MSATSASPQLGLAGKIGAGAFALWGVLHVWVGAEGVRQYLSGGTKALLTMFLGGANAPVASFQHSTDTVTSAVLGHLGLNFVIDVGAAGLLGLALAWMIWKKASWSAYFIAVVVIGVIDNAFLFSQVIPGYIELNAGTIGGPVIWAVACIVTPFGLPPLSKSAPSTQPMMAR